METLKKIKIIPFAIFQAFLFGLVGLVVGVLYSFGGLIIDILVSLDWLTSTHTPGLSYGTILAFGALIGMPCIAACTGFLFGICQALLYNLFSKFFGGINQKFLFMPNSFYLTKDIHDKN